MFADAIEKVSKYTRPVKFIMRNYGSADIITGSSTLFFVNENGVAVTCRHIADELLKCGTINAKYAQYKAELSKSALKAAKKEALARKYGYDPSVTVQYNSMFVDCAEVKGGNLSFTVRSHPKYDLAVIILQNAVKYQYSGHAVFAADTSKLRTGDFLCRYGYPFCEFTDYKYDERKDELSWVKSGKVDTPAFPTEGMFTRNVADESGRIYMYELSTPGLLGQSGGPLFDKSGTVYGMQAQTAYLHMGFDQYGAEVIIDGQKRKVEDHPFLHVGRCITADIIKEFLKSSGIKFYVGDPGGKVRTVNG